MATYTPNLNLGKPESTDPFGDFRQLFNDNMDILDNGGGGGSGGHTIVNENGTDMPAEGKLQFTGGVTVTDDSVNGKTVVDISGGGGNVYGAFIDTNRVITSGTYSSSDPLNYTATEDCFVDVVFISSDGTKEVKGYVDGVNIYRLLDSHSGTAEVYNQVIPLKKGQTLRVETSRTDSSSAYTVYGLTQGTNGIFTPIIYSDTERVVGVWRDNKPLYQKTAHIGAISANTSSAFSVGVGANVVDTMVSYNVIAYVSSGAWVNLPQPLPSNISSYASYVDNYNKANDTINIITGADRDFSDAFVTVQYTKTTDVAGSGNWNTDGVPTVHYSTTEQVIGTWIDGKPLYQISISLTSGITIGSYGYVSLPVNSVVRDWWGTVYRNNYLSVDKFNGYINGGDIFSTIRSGNIEYNISNAFAGVEELDFTIQYTKTTD